MIAAQRLCSLVAIGLLSLCLAPPLARSEFIPRTQEDGYLRKPAAREWLLGTGAIEKTLRLSETGRFELVSLINKSPAAQSAPEEHDYLAENPTPEFLIGLGDQIIAGSDQGWTLEDESTSLGAQGELELALTLHRDPLRVIRHYKLYPGTGLIREWMTLENASGQPVELTNPGFFQLTIPIAKRGWEAGWFTGGIIGPGTQRLMLKPAGGTFRKDLESEGSASHLPLLILHEPDRRHGVAVGWDYLGPWQALLGASGGRNTFGFDLRLDDYRRTLQPGERIETPLAFVQVFRGDLDDLGNRTLDWQYRYLWQYKQDAYFAQPRLSVNMVMPYWGRVGTEENWSFQLMLDLYFMDLARYCGAGVLWNDAGWYDEYGSWNGPDFSQTINYAHRQDLQWKLWFCPSAASPGSRVEQDLGPLESKHKFDNYWAPGQDTRAGMDWQLDILSDRIRKWGDFQWRWDMWVGYAPDRLAADQEFRRINREFLARHPRSAVDACMSGGIWIGYELGEFANSGELTDGGVLDYSGYHTTMLVPPELLHDYTLASVSKKRYDAGVDRLRLRTLPMWSNDPGRGEGLIGEVGGGDRQPPYIAGSTLALQAPTIKYLESVRHDFDIYRHLVAEGVAGRWGHVFRPRVKGDAAVHYFQRMNRDGSKGVLLCARPCEAPSSTPDGAVTVWPKGLIADLEYDVRFDFAEPKFKRTGAQLMEDGIVLKDLAPGEIVYLNLPFHPGSGEDENPPLPPRGVTQRVATQIYTQGVEVAWEPAADDHWVSYYKVRRIEAGGSIDDLGKVARGTYYFDHELPAAKLAAHRYEVCTVDGDGNTSLWVEARPLPGELETHTGFGGYGPKQGFRGWSYELTDNGLDYKPLPVWSAWYTNATIGEGYEGRWADLYGVALVARTLMRPSPTYDLARTFTAPRGGEAVIRGTVRKDPSLGVILSPRCRVKIMQNERQLWPAEGWATLPLEGEGLSYEVHITLMPNDKIHHVLQRSPDGASADIAWHPAIQYQEPMELPKHTAASSDRLR